MNDLTRALALGPEGRTYMLAWLAGEVPGDVWESALIAAERFNAHEASRSPCHGDSA